MSSLLNNLKSSLQAFTASRKHLSLDFAVTREYRAQILERPGQWASDEQLDKIFAACREVAREGQVGKEMPEYGVLLGTRECVKERLLTLLYTNEGEPVAFNAVTYFQFHLGAEVETVVHVGLTFIKPSHQRKHLAGLVNGLAAFLLVCRNRLGGFWVSNVTQVPAAFGTFAEHFSDVYPSYLPGARQSFKHLLLSRQIVRHHKDAFGVGEDAWFDEHQQIIRNAYTGGSDHLKKKFSEVPLHKLDSVNQICQQNLDYGRGDDFLQLGKCSLRSMLRFMTGRLPKGSPGRIGMNAASLVGLGTVVPVLQWLYPPELAPGGFDQLNG